MENYRVEFKTAGFEFLKESGDRAGGAVLTDYFAAVAESCLPVFENILHHYLVPLKADYLGDRGDFTGAVGQAGDLDNNVYG